MWPERKRFAFTIFDDTDLETIANGPGVYAFLTGLGMRVTKSVWVSPPTNAARYGGSSCAEPDYLAWVFELQRAGHEIALHNVASSTSTRGETLAGLDRFRELFGHDPRTLANHVGNLEAIYHGENRVSGVRRAIHNVLTLGRRRRLFEGHVPESPLFWGDACAERVSYVRNFVYRGVDTLAACPHMPYRDSAKPTSTPGSHPRRARIQGPSCGRSPTPSKIGWRPQAGSASCTRTSVRASGVTERSIRSSSAS
jgi:hypothetical protein